MPQGDVDSLAVPSDKPNSDGSSRMVPVNKSRRIPALSPPIKSGRASKSHGMAGMSMIVEHLPSMDKALALETKAAWLER